jgi:hypothetical protein
MTTIFSSIKWHRKRYAVFASYREDLSIRPCKAKETASTLSPPCFVVVVVPSLSWQICIRDLVETIRWRKRDPTLFLLPHLQRGSTLFCEFSLCLSRACLGKKIVVIYKWLQNGVLRTCKEVPLAAADVFRVVRLALVHPHSAHPVLPVAFPPVLKRPRHTYS